jgi:7-cyano-7-deazaguanine synthase
MSKAVIVFSGGQDSTTVLGKAMHDGFECYAIGFDYGQRHEIELRQADTIARKLGVPYHVVNVRAFGKLVASKTALIGGLCDGGGDVSAQSSLAHMPAGIPASFVPNRNALFLTIAHGYAQVIGADSIWTGVCQTDYSGYPDCRSIFIHNLERALNIGYQTSIAIKTPLMDLTKAETFKMAEECDVLDLVIEQSHTCYNGVRAPNWMPASHPHFHEWGHGCGECPACKLRAKGWEEYKNFVRIA